MDSTAFLSPKPSSWRRVSRYSSAVGTNLSTSVNNVTGDIQVEGSRLNALPLPPGWHVASHGYEHEYTVSSNDDNGEVEVYDPQMNAKTFRERGVDLQDFRLVWIKGGE